MNRTCSQCSQLKPLTDFAIKRKGRAAICKSCQRLYAKQHYIRYKDGYLSRSKRRRQELKDYVQAIKGGTSCKDCGLIYPYYVMDFDHVSSDAKAGDVNYLIARGTTLAALKSEIAKCEVVCSNCHRIRTHQRYLAECDIIN